MTNILLWIDDERPMPKNFTHRAKSSQEAIDFLSQPMEGVLSVIAFDHDLSYNPQEGHTKTDPDEFVYDDVRRVVRWMHKHNVYPELAVVHTQNPVGATWIMNELKDHTKVIRMPYNPKDWIYEETPHSA